MFKIEVTSDVSTGPERHALYRVLQEAAAKLYPGKVIRITVRDSEVQLAAEQVPLTTRLNELAGLNQYIIGRLNVVPILTVGDLLLLGSEKKLLEIPGIGSQELKIINRVLAKHGRMFVT